MSEAISIVALVVLLAVAVRRPRWPVETLAAIAMAVLVVGTGAVSLPHARQELARLGPVVGFLAAVLVLAEGCAGEGLFKVAGELMARTARRSPTRMLLAVGVCAAVTTAALSLDTTAVLFTPVVVATLRVTQTRPRAPLYATAHLANTASLLLPVSNLTNLLAVAVVPISFLRFSGLMVLPWLVGIVIELLGARLVFRSDFDMGAESVTAEAPRRRQLVPRFATTVVVLTVLGFGATSVVQVRPVWVAVAGAAVLTLRRLWARRVTPAGVVTAASPSFCLLVLALAVVARGVSDHGLSDAVHHVLRTGNGLLPLLGVAALAAVVANIVNNLPATLLLLPVVAIGGVGPVLAMLIGVNVGPNLAYPGSLATLLWRDGVKDVPGVPELRDFSRLALATTPLALVGSTAALWVALRVIGT